MRVAELDGSWRILAGGDDEPETVSWGSADFIAAEEMRRQRGYWWNPDGSVVAATRVDTASVTTVWIADPAQPSTAPRQTPYPFAGTDNPDVSLHLIDLAGEVVDVDWDRVGFPVPRRGPLVGHWPRHLDPVAFATGAGDSRRGRRLRGDHRALRRLRRSVGRTRQRYTPPLDGRRTRHVRRPRRRPPADRRRRGGDPDRPAGAFRRRRRPWRHRVHRQPDRRRDRVSCVAVRRGRTRCADRRTRRAHRRRRAAERW